MFAKPFHSCVWTRVGSFVLALVLLALVACQPAAQPVTEPVMELAAEPVMEPVIEPVVEPAHGEAATPAATVAAEQETVVDLDPVAATTAFYDWYLAYANPEAGHNPLVDGAYKDAPYINPAFAAAVEAELAEARAGGGLGHDPILQAQAFPPDFSVEAGEEEGTVIVDMHFANPHRLEVQMEMVDGQWLVSGVRRLEEPVAAPASQIDTTGWETVADAEYGFSFQIPPGWVAVAQDLSGPGMPDDWPVVQQYLVMPAAMGEQLAARTGPPAGDEIPLIPPFTVSFLQGDQAAFDRVYVTAEDVQMVQLNGREIEVQRQGQEYVIPRYIFREGQRWLVVEDVVGEFPGREVQAAEVFGVLDGMLATISFDG